MKKKANAIEEQKKSKKLKGKIVAQINTRSTGHSGDCAIVGRKEDLLNLLINNLEHNDMFSDLLREAVTFKLMGTIGNMIEHVHANEEKPKKSSKKKVAAKSRK